MAKKRKQKDQWIDPIEYLVKGFQELLKAAEQHPEADRDRFHNHVFIWVLQNHPDAKSLSNRAVEGFVLKMKNAKRHRPRKNEERDRQIFEKKKTGKSYGQLGKEYKLSVGGVRSAIKRAISRESMS